MNSSFLCLRDGVVLDRMPSTPFEQDGILKVLGPRTALLWWPFVGQSIPWCRQGIIEHSSMYLNVSVQDYQVVDHRCPYLMFLGLRLCDRCERCCHHEKVEWNLQQRFELRTSGTPIYAVENGENICTRIYLSFAVILFGWGRRTNPWHQSSPRINHGSLSRK